MQSASPRCARPILAALLTFSLAACSSGSSQTAAATAGPPSPSTREIQGYFTSPTTRSSLRLWRGPNDYKGFERLTRLTVEVDGVPEYSMAVSTVQLAGVCRTSGSGLDQLLLTFHTERRGGERLGVLRYDTKRGRFTLSFTPRDITKDGGMRLDCSGARAILPEGAPAFPCTCPWRDDPDHPSPRSATDATMDTREILILPEEPGGTP